jgi:hypothetical protein
MGVTSSHDTAPHKFSIIYVFKVSFLLTNRPSLNCMNLLPSCVATDCSLADVSYAFLSFYSVSVILLVFVSFS